MLALKPLFTVNRVTVFGDNADPDQFYYLPETVHLATDSAGKPSFTLIKYMRDITDNPTFTEGQQLGGGFLIFSVNLSLDDDTRSQILRQASRFSADSPRLATAPFTDGEVKVLALDATSTPVEGRIRFVENVIGTTKPSLFGDLQATFSLELSQEGVTLLEQAFERGGQPIGLVYDLKFLGLRPAFDVTVKADYKRIYDEFNAKLAAQYMVIRAEIEAGFQKLIQDKAIDITVNSYTDDANLRQQQEDALKFFKEDLLRDFFTPSLSPPAAQSTSILGELASSLGLTQPAARNMANPGATPTAGPATPSAQTAGATASPPAPFATPLASSTSASAIRTAAGGNPSQGVTTTVPHPTPPTSSATGATTSSPTPSSSAATPTATASSPSSTPSSSSTASTGTGTGSASSTPAPSSPSTPTSSSAASTPSATSSTTPTPPHPATPAGTPAPTPASAAGHPATSGTTSSTPPGTHPTPAAGGTPTPAARPNQAAPAQSGGGNNLAIGFTMRYIHQEELKTFTMSWKEAAAVEQHHTPNGTFGVLMRGLNKSEHFISVNLDDDFFQRLKVMVDCPTPFASIGLSEVKLHLEYGDRGDGQPRYVDDIELKPDAQGHVQPQELTCALDDRHHLAYKYRLDFYFDPSTSIRGQKMHYTTDMMTSLDRMLTIDPATFVGFLNVAASVGDLNFDEIPRIQVKIGYDDDANAFHVEDSFVLSKDKPTFEWRVRLSDPAQKTYWYEVTYFLTGDRNIQLPRQTASGQNLVINEPWADRLDVLVDALWDDTLAHFVLQLDYEDTPNNYRYSVVKRLASQNDVPISLSIPVIDRNQREYRYQTTALGTDNSVHRAPPVQSQDTYLLMNAAPAPAPQS